MRRAAPLMATPRVKLVPTSPSHYEALYAISNEYRVSLAWRSRGAVLPFDSFVGLIWQDSFVSFTLVEPATAAVVGLLSLYHVDLRNRFGYVAVFVSDAANVRVPFDAAMLMLIFVRSQLPLLNLYAEVGAAAEESFSVGFGRLFEVEARLRGREYLDGAQRDVLLGRCNIARVDARISEFESRLRKG